MTRAELAKLAKTRLVPIAFLTAIALIANSTCHKQERVHATVVLELGDAAPRVHEVQADLFVGDDSVGTFHREAHDGPIGPCKFPVALPAKDAQLHIEVTLASGEVRVIERRLHAEDRATVTVPLQTALDAVPTAP